MSAAISASAHASNPEAPHPELKGRQATIASGEPSADAASAGRFGAAYQSAAALEEDPATTEAREEGPAEAGEKDLAETREQALAAEREKDLADAHQQAVAAAREQAHAEAREKALAEVRDKELAEARETAVAEAQRARELLKAREQELAEVRDKELAEARRAREIAEARENRLVEAREKELADSRRASDLAAAREREQQARTEAVVDAREARYRAYRRGGLAVSFGAAALAVVSYVLGDDLELVYRTQLLLTICLSAAAFFCLVGALLLPRFLDARRREQDAETRARESAHEALEQLADAADLPALIRANRKQMEAYDILARAQAKTAFRNSQIAMGAGLLVLFVGAVIAIGTSDPTSKITTASLTAIGGVLSGFIARTFLRTYSRSLRQLNFYFQQPLINSYLLSAQRLINEMTEDQRDPALSEVITSVMGVVVRLPWSGAELQADDRSRPPTVVDAAPSGADR